MPLKSWAFQYGEHAVRAEVWWRFTGWYRKRLFVDHKRVVGKRGRFQISRPLTEHIDPLGAIEVRFQPRRLGLDMDCQVKIDNRALSWDEIHPAIEKRRSHSIKEEGIEIHGGESLGCFIAFPLLIVLGALSIPFGLLAALLMAAGFGRRSDRKFEIQMQKSGRFLEWEEIEKGVNVAPSTLIIQAAGAAPMRCWWTEDDIRTSSPLPLPPFHEVCSPGGRSNDPFVAWSHAVYLSESSGKAFLTKPPEKLLGQVDFFEDDEQTQVKISAEYPKLKLAAISYPGKETIRVASSFAQVVGRDLNQAIPGLIQTLKSDDAFLRQLALTALKEAGPAVSQFVPALAEHFYFGPWDDQYRVTEALTAAGPAGLDFLAKAAQWQDPVFRHRAQMELNAHAYHLEHPPTKRVIRVSSKPKETPAKPPRQIKFGVVWAIAYWLVMLGACVACFVRFGIIVGIASLFGALVFTVLFSTIPHIIATLWRVRKLRREQKASPDDFAKKYDQPVD